MMTEDKTIRRALIEKYLNAETTPEEERQLRDWYALHEAADDERDVALLVGLDAPCSSCLPELDETEAEFDRIAAGKHKRLRWGIGIAAAASIASLVWLALPARQTEKPLSPVVIAEGIKQIMFLSPDEIESVVAKPAGAHAILTAQMKDGRSYSYILTYDEDEGTTSFLAYQNP